jgi:hypothetical protein
MFTFLSPFCSPDGSCYCFLLFRRNVNTRFFNQGNGLLGDIIELLACYHKIISSIITNDSDGNLIPLFMFFRHLFKSLSLCFDNELLNKNIRYDPECCIDTVR